MKTLFKNHQQLFFSLTLRFLTQVSKYFYYTLMPVLMMFFNVSSQTMKLTVSVFFFSLMFSLFFAGPLIAILHEKRSFWLSLCVFFVGTIVCIFSFNVYVMIGGRILQGLAVGIIQILSKDLIAASSDAAKNFSIYLIACILAQPFGILMASFLLYLAYWQASFIFLLIFSILPVWMSIYWKNEISNGPRTHSNFDTQIKKYLLLLNNKKFLPFICSYSLISTIFTPCYVTATYTITDVLHEPVHFVGLMSVVFAISSIASSLLSIKLQNHSINKYAITIGFSVAIFGCVMFVIGSIMWPPSMITLVLPLIFYAFGASFLYSKFNLVILEHFESVSRDVTLSAMAVCCALMSSVGAFIASFLSHNTMIETSFLMLIMSVISVILYRVAIARELIVSK